MKTILSIFIALAVCGVGGAEAAEKTATKSRTTSVSKPAAQLSSPGGGKHCLWRVSDSSAPFYLLGSIHYLRASEQKLPVAVDNAINECNRFYFEIDPDKMGVMHHKLVAAAHYPIGTQIRRKVRPETWEYLKKIATGGGYEWTNYKPWAIALFILDHPGLRTGASWQYGVEQYVEKKAKKKPHEFAGLETAEEHAQVFTGMTDVESEAVLLEALVYASQNVARHNAIVAAWRSGNTQRLAELEYPDLSDAPGVNAKLLYNRNERWIPVIESAMRSGRPTLVVAGAAHFSGPRSVLAMLRARGHKIEQL